MRDNHKLNRNNNKKKQLTIVKTNVTIKNHRQSSCVNSFAQQTYAN